MTTPPPHAIPPAPPEVFDELDPHGVYHGHQHSHVILRMSTLVGVLTALLVFTVMTVGATRLEEWVIYDLGVELPAWVNIFFVALSIAVVKSILVALFFMQLKYDNPMNALAFCFCLFGVGLFMGLTLLDLGNRDTIYAWKSGQIQDGGMGVLVTGESNKKYLTGGKPIVVAAREKYREKLLNEMGGSVEKMEAEYERQEAEQHHGHHGPAHADHEPLSTPNRSRKSAGPGLFGSAPPPPQPAGEHGAEAQPPAAPASPPAPKGH